MATDSSPKRRKSDARVVSFGPFRLDRASRQLWKSDQEIEISIRAFDLVSLLIDNSDRAVSRQELLDELWDGRVVTDNTLSQLVSSIRKQLDDSAEQARYIRTVHGYGLQWVAPVESIDTVRDELVEGTPAADEPSTAQRDPSWKPWFALLAAAVLLIIALSSFWMGRQVSPADGPALTRTIDPQPGQVILAILPIDSAGNAETELLGLSITDYLTTRLRNLPGISVLEPEELARIQSQPTVDTVRRQVNPDFILEARLAAAGQPERANFIARVVPRGGPVRELTARELALPDIPNDFAYFYNARQAMVEELANVISPGATLPPLGESQPNDPEALRIALSADRVLRSTLCDHQGLDRQLQTAIAKTPNSAYLWWLLGNHYFTRVWGCGEPVTLLEQAFAAAAKADVLAPGRYQATAQLRHTYLLETGQTEQAYAFALERGPDTAEGLYRIALSLRYAGFVDEAKQHIERILEIDPLHFYQGRYGRAPNSLLYRGDLVEFIEAIPASGPYHSYYYGFVRLLNDDVEGARENLNQAFNDFPSDMFGSLSRALLAHLDGDDRLAVEVVRQVAAGRARLPLRDGEVTYKQAQLLALAGDKEGALQTLEQTIEQGFFCLVCFEADAALSALQGEVEFGSLIERARERQVRFAATYDLTAPD